jgi:iron complex transport system ATP-binding protein
MGVLLDVNNLRVARGHTEILRDVNWRIQRGENWVILGANGSGKTTLLKTLTGYMPPSSGALTVLGRTYGSSDWRELRLRIGVVTSAFATAIPSAEPVIDTVISGKYAQLDLWHRVSREDRAQAGRLLRFIGLDALADREWAYLSQGERQRVLIARALMGRPKVLILVEPCSGLDPVAREQFLAFIERLARRRSAPCLVLVTHHVEEIVPAFTHALLLRKGAVVATGLRGTVLTNASLRSTFGAPLRLSSRGGRYQLTFSRSW